MTREIGSEFHKLEFGKGHGLPFPVKGCLVFSGRTAIETVLKELPHAKKAVLPSYCCDSMIEPFRRAGIIIEFYPVRYEDGLQIDAQIPQDADILLWCNYFGYHTPMPDLLDFKKRGGLVIEDITHSLLSSSPYNSQSDYLVASIRKWEPINCGGYCAAVNGDLKHTPTLMPPSNFVDNKTSAMNMKTEYLNDLDEQKKQQFLAMFGESNHWLAENYLELAIDPWSEEYLTHVDAKEQKRIRRSNAHVLYEGIKNKVQFLFSEEDMDCPLFVPVVIPNRNEVRKILTENRIYCPVHWPKREGCCSNLYDLELSLICDQRYNEDDMRRIVSVISKMNP